MISQNQVVLAALKRGKRVTAIWAEKKHIHRVSSCIHILRRQGHDIRKDMKKRPNKLTGKTSRYAEYFIGDSK